MTNNIKPAPSPAQLTTKYTTARMNLLMMIAFTLVNIILQAFNSNLYFLFSATLPYRRY